MKVLLSTFCGIVVFMGFLPLAGVSIAAEQKEMCPRYNDGSVDTTALRMVI